MGKRGATVVLLKDEILVICNALIAEAKDFESLHERLPKASKSTRLVWQTKAKENRELSGKLLSALD